MAGNVSMSLSLNRESFQLHNNTDHVIYFYFPFYFWRPVYFGLLEPLLGTHTPLFPEGSVGGVETRRVSGPQARCATQTAHSSRPAGEHLHPLSASKTLSVAERGHRGGSLMRRIKFLRATGLRSFTMRPFSVIRALFIFICRSLLGIFFT